MNSKVKGYIFGVLAAATYGMNPLFALPLYDEGLNANSVLLLRYFAALPILWAMIAMRGRSLKLRRCRPTDCLQVIHIWTPAWRRHFCLSIL